ncbi:hypothetical protein OPV22_011904 [Ensete ventricosum]|uniref:Uncharacterized protein n=1 Tax=Ensete ventricosum TaxID=4639 RepID=A0AAV8RIY9_ENSVE|nr:hypothetical protein OPV22_011904 [Ensete ventricosum]
MHSSPPCVRFWRRAEKCQLQRFCAPYPKQRILSVPQPNRSPEGRKSPSWFWKVHELGNRWCPVAKARLRCFCMQPRFGVS